MSHPVLTTGKVALITGAASGIGLAAAKRLAGLGMRVCLSDRAEQALRAAGSAVSKIATGGAGDVLTVTTDVADRDSMETLKHAVDEKLGRVDLLMNNAVTRVGGSTLENPDNWHQAMNVNLHGVIYGVQAFVPDMIARGEPGLVVNCGSKQGITNPPGNAAYNVTKSALKTYTEALQHELRNIEGNQVSAHLLIPGWTTTGEREHKPGAWLPDQVVGRLIEALSAGDFYIVCPDDEVTPEMDAKRILWAAGDITENRPPLSRWHPDFKAAFDGF